MFAPGSMDIWERSIRLLIDYLIMLGIIDNFLILALGKEFLIEISLIDACLTIILLIMGFLVSTLTKKGGKNDF